MAGTKEEQFVIWLILNLKSSMELIVDDSFSVVHAHVHAHVYLHPCDAQFYVSKLSIDQKAHTYTLPGYLRAWCVHTYT